MSMTLPLITLVKIVHIQTESHKICICFRKSLQSENKHSDRKHIIVSESTSLLLNEIIDILFRTFSTNANIKMFLFILTSIEFLKFSLGFLLSYSGWDIRISFIEFLWDFNSLKETSFILLPVSSHPFIYSEHNFRILWGFIYRLKFWGCLFRFLFFIRSFI